MTDLLCSGLPAAQDTLVSWSSLWLRKAVMWNRTWIQRLCSLGHFGLFSSAPGFASTTGRVWFLFAFLDSYLHSKPNNFGLDVYFVEFPS